MSRNIYVLNSNIELSQEADNAVISFD